MWHKSILDQQNRSWHLLSYVWLKCRFWTWATPKHHAMLIVNSPGHHNMYTLHHLLCYGRWFALSSGSKASQCFFSPKLPTWAASSRSEDVGSAQTSRAMHMHNADAWCICRNSNPQPIVHYPIQTPTCTHPMLWVLNHTETYERY